MSPSYTTQVPLPTHVLTAAGWTLTQQSLRKCPSDTPGGRYDGGSSSAESPSSQMTKADQHRNFIIAFPDCYQKLQHIRQFWKKQKLLSHHSGDQMSGLESRFQQGHRPRLSVEVSCGIDVFLFQLLVAMTFLDLWLLYSNLYFFGHRTSSPLACPKTFQLSSYRGTCGGIQD